MIIKSGTRLRSQVCTTEVIVIRSTEDSLDLRAGGVALVPLDGEIDPAAELDPAFADGTTVGKRYTAAGGVEVLVTKAGTGSLSVGGEPLNLKSSKPLPASD